MKLLAGLAACPLIAAAGLLALLRRQFQSPEELSFDVADLVAYIANPDAFSGP